MFCLGCDVYLTNRLSDPENNKVSAPGAFSILESMKDPLT